MFVLSLVALVLFLGGCRFLSSEKLPPGYRSVGTLRGLSDLAEPFGIAAKDGVIYVSDGSAGTIRRIDAGGTESVAVSGLNTPSAIAFLPDGDLIVADTGSHTIRRISADGSITVLAGLEGIRGSNDGPARAATFNAPVGLAVTQDGGVYVSDTYNDRIRLIRDGMVSTIAGSTRGFTDGAGLSAKFDTPLGIAVFGDNLLIADSGNARIRLLEANGNVITLAGSDERSDLDGTLSVATFVTPTAITTDEFGRIFVADGNAIRMIGGRLFPTVETLAGDKPGSRHASLNRPSGLALGASGELYIADSDNGVIRVLSGDKNAPSNMETERRNVVDDPLPLATRWPFDPPSNPREIAGTLGEVRGVIGPENKPAWFHNGLDIAGAYGETARFVRDETVLAPDSADNFGTARELLRMPLIGYIHLRLGRDKDDQTFDDPRFEFERDVSGKLTGIRVPRGAKFAAGDAIGTLNAMNHVHLIAGRNGREINALEALKLPGINDTIAPVIEEARLYDFFWNSVSDGRADRAAPLSDRIRIVVRAYDRMDGNSERRRLGVYRVGYQLLSNGAPLGETEWRISFERSPSNDAVRLAYANGSRSGYTPDTVFDYIATNRVDGEIAREDFLDTTKLAPGKYILRVFAADYFGNVGSKDVDVVK